MKIGEPRGRGKREKHSAEEGRLSPNPPKAVRILQGDWMKSLLYKLKKLNRNHRSIVAFRQECLQWNRIIVQPQL